MSYITDLRHVLNDAGDILPAMPHEAREPSSFLALVVDAVTASYPEQPWSIETGIRCRTSACSGEIIGALDSTDDPVHWYCLGCGADATIRGWRETRWDNVSPPRLGVDTWVGDGLQGKKTS